MIWASPPSIFHKPSIPEPLRSQTLKPSYLCSDLNEALLHSQTQIMISLFRSPFSTFKQTNSLQSFEDEQDRDPRQHPTTRVPMSLMLFMERLYMGVVITLVKIFLKKPEKRYKWEPLPDDVEMGSSHFPSVLIQIPMFNEREVYKISIGAACNLSWPADRMVIQVLDDSTNPVIKE